QAAQPPPPERGDGLDAPLLNANMCGAGDAGDVHFTLAATGDTFPHENIQNAAEANGYDYLFERVRPFLQAADLAYTNFDGAMLEGSPFTGYPAFNFSPKLAAALKNAGISLVSTANNHIMDRGPEGLDATLRVFEQNGIRQHGTVPSTQTDQPRPVFLPLTLTRDGVSIKVAFLSFSWGTNGIPDPYNQVNLLWASSEYGEQGGVRPEVLDAIAQARRESDLVIVAAHWGYEYQFYPDAVQIEGAAKLAAAGADIILGAQPHTLQPVDIIDTGGRKTLVMYSLANFLASQGAFQAESFSATSVILYVGIVKAADGTVRVTGYRYLPTIHVDDDTRPAPIPTEGYADVIDHVRLEMRDFAGMRQLSPDPAALGGRVEVCPRYAFPGLPEAQIGGDFAQYLAARPPEEVLTLVGAPLGPVGREPSGDCGANLAVLLTERQRLELHPEADWPFRVTGSQLGSLVYQQKYNVANAPRRTNLDGDAIADERFKRFFQTYGGVPMFGYPISGALTEPDAAGQPQTVQYFERARFELAADAPADAPLLAQVRLGALGREFAGIEALCGVPASTAALVPTQAIVVQPVVAAPQVVDVPATAIEPAARPLWPWLLLLAIGGVIGAAVWDNRRRRRKWEQRLARRRRLADSRVQPRPPTPSPTPARTIRPRREQEDEELLRRLLGDK
ncbi:MAG TPA: CapA family protein, partial [Roseiflexaceae bacterium]|nr:CapA family protein [Roseiflexaceae bacterium]